MPSLRRSPRSASASSSRPTSATSIDTANDLDHNEVFDQVEARADASGDLARVQLAARRLTPDQLELLRLVAWEGLSTADIATVLGCSHNAAKIRIHRMRRQLDKHLAQIDRTTRHLPEGR